MEPAKRETEKGEENRISVLRDPIVGEIGNGERLKEYSYGQFEKKKKRIKIKLKLVRRSTTISRNKFSREENSPFHPRVKPNPSSLPQHPTDDRHSQRSIENYFTDERRRCAT